MEKEKLEKKIKKLQERLDYVKLGEKIEAVWETQFGWPEIRQSLSLEKKLDKETYNQLHDKISAKLKEIISMMPPYKKWYQFWK
jgi:hypothetical protein